MARTPDQSGRDTRPQSRPHVVRRLDGAQLIRDPSKPALAFAGWLSREAGESLLALAGKTVDEALKEADTKGFKAIPLGVRIKGHIPTTVQKITGAIIMRISAMKPSPSGFSATPVFGK